MVASERIKDAESRARELGLDISDLCKAASVHRATWQRWKGGQGAPDINQWDAVEQLLAKKAA